MLEHRQHVGAAATCRSNGKELWQHFGAATRSIDQEHRQIVSAKSIGKEYRQRISYIHYKKIEIISTLLNQLYK
jgi:hypothetical protein